MDRPAVLSALAVVLFLLGYLLVLLAAVPWSRLFHRDRWGLGTAPVRTIVGVVAGGLLILAYQTAPDGAVSRAILGLLLGTVIFVLGEWLRERRRRVRAAHTAALTSVPEVVTARGGDVAAVPRPRRRRRQPAVQTPADAVRESMSRRW
jgi:hypothetical protein